MISSPGENIFRQHLFLRQQCYAYILLAKITVEFYFSNHPSFSNVEQILSAFCVPYSIFLFLCLAYINERTLPVAIFYYNKLQSQKKISPAF